MAQQDGAQASWSSELYQAQRRSPRPQAQLLGYPQIQSMARGHGAPATHKQFTGGEKAWAGSWHGACFAERPQWRVRKLGVQLVGDAPLCIVQTRRRDLRPVTLAAHLIGRRVLLPRLAGWRSSTSAPRLSDQADMIWDDSCGSRPGGQDVQDLAAWINLKRRAWGTGRSGHTHNQPH